MLMVNYSARAAGTCTSFFSVKTGKNRSFHENLQRIIQFWALCGLPGVFRRWSGRNATDFAKGQVQIVRTEFKK